MKPLHLKTPKPYGESRMNEQPFRKKFFIISEGSTEESYFRGVNNYKRELEIKNQIKLHIIEKETGEETKSCPRQLVDAALFNMGRIDQNGDAIPEKEWGKHCQWDADFAIDSVCVIFDRDYKKLENQIDYIYEQCSKHNIIIGFSNPNFEFWLLLHLPNIEQYDSKKLHENLKNLHGQIMPEKSYKKKYLELLLSDKLNGYHKGEKLDFDKFLKEIPLAIQQEKKFEEDVKKIFEKLGCNIGIILSGMMK